ncbi:Zn-finger protein [Candidatus Magnetomorum sp. HK-1]|nr:Zn-finger protein [Candidatus Magnetomorum sp. HK-1]
MNKCCHSCGIPINMPEFQGPSKNYCKHCTDKDGIIKPKEEIKKGIAVWLKSWQGDLSEKDSLNRAEHYMLAMPAWAQ